MSIWTLDDKDLSYSCPSIANKLLMWRSWRKSVGDIECLKLVLQDYRINVFNKDTQFNNVVRSVISSVEALLSYFNYDCVEDFLYELEDINENLNARIKKKNVRVSIATVHEYKGKEADSVYIWNDSEDVFPIWNSTNSKEEYEEERRIHYIACTRAREVSTLVYLKDREGDFVKEMDFSNAEKITNSVGGVVKSVKMVLEEDSNLEKFKQMATTSEGDSKTSKVLTTDDCVPDELDDFSLPSYIDSSPADCYGDNEFWGKSGEKYYED